MASVPRHIYRAIQSASEPPVHRRVVNHCSAAQALRERPGPGALSKQCPAPGEAGARRVLILDDSPLQILLLRRLLEALGFEVASAGTPAEARAQIAMRRPDLLLVELLPGQGNGFEHGSLLMEAHGIPAILLSASGRGTDVLWARRLGFAHCLRCPPGLRDVQRAVRAAGFGGA